ncbi:MAG: DUF4397 domain-containing protein [Flavobacteriales bacterium]|nr:DUF4397 domain-containing protein [Flavobacteriales bacterium]
MIHNSADLAATQVDVWLDNTLLLDNFALRTASPFIDAPAGVRSTSVSRCRTARWRAMRSSTRRSYLTPTRPI